MNKSRKSREDKSDKSPKSGFKGVSKGKSTQPKSIERETSFGGKLRQKEEKPTRGRSKPTESAGYDRPSSRRNSEAESFHSRKPRNSREESFGSEEKRSFRKSSDKREDKSFERKPRESRTDGKSFEKKSFAKKEDSSFGRKTRDTRFTEKDSGRKTYANRDVSGSDDKKPRENKFTDRKSSSKREDRGFKEIKPREVRAEEIKNDRKSFDRKYPTGKPYTKSYSKRKEYSEGASNEKKHTNSGDIRLNKFIANAGICSRRKADDLIKAGTVSVNDEVINELGYLVKPGDKIRYNGELLKREKNVYILLNKPKNIITTTNDPQERKTIMGLIGNATSERVYPVGRLDRNTTGLILLTNDGNLAEKLSHPRNRIQKIYDISLDKPLKKEDFDKIRKGLVLEDGPIQVEEIAYVEGGTKRDIGIVIQSGKNRIVRRIFEHLEYEVQKLDRVMFGPLTKKDLPRGKWRYLSEQEVIQLKHFVK